MVDCLFGKFPYICIVNDEGQITKQTFKNKNRKKFGRKLKSPYF